MQGELEACSNYLQQAISYLDQKLDSIKTQVAQSQTNSSRGS